MKQLLMLLALTVSLQGYSQFIKVVNFDCPDSLGYVTNQGGTSRSVTFFLEPNDSPAFYYVENFTHKDFYKLIYEKDTKVISRVKPIQLGHVAKPYQFIYAFNSRNVLMYYYILKDWKEEKLLMP